MKHCSNTFLIATITCGLLLSVSLAETTNGSIFTGTNNSNTIYAETTNLTLNDSANNSYFTMLETNSTVSELLFNRTSSEITFTVTGPSGTSGYVWCKIAESLIPDGDLGKSVKVFLDGNRIYFLYKGPDPQSPNGGSWELFLNYTHSDSAQEAVISLPKAATLFGIDVSTWIAILIVIFVPSIAAVVFWRRKQKVNKQKEAVQQPNFNATLLHRLSWRL